MAVGPARTCASASQPPSRCVRDPETLAADPVLKGRPQFTGRPRGHVRHRSRIECSPERKRVGLLCSLPEATARTCLPCRCPAACPRPTGACPAVLAAHPCLAICPGVTSAWTTKAVVPQLQMGDGVCRRCAAGAPAPPLRRASRSPWKRRTMPLSARAPTPRARTTRLSGPSPRPIPDPTPNPNQSPVLR